MADLMRRCAISAALPEALLEGIVLLQARIQNEDMRERWMGDPIVVGAERPAVTATPIAAPTVRVHLHAARATLAARFGETIDEESQ